MPSDPDDETPSKSRIAASPRLGRKPMTAEPPHPRGDHRLSNIRATDLRKRVSWTCSRANALITRTPDTFSSASA
jgi:hypothetical protein